MGRGRMMIWNVLHTRNYHGISKGGNKNSFTRRCLKVPCWCYEGACYETAGKEKCLQSILAALRFFIPMQDLLPSPVLLCSNLSSSLNMNECARVCMCLYACVRVSRPPPFRVCRQGSSEKWKFTVACVGTWVVCDSEAASNLWLGFNCL